MKPVLNRTAAKAVSAPLSKREIPTLVEQLIKSFADRLPPPPTRVRP